MVLVNSVSCPFVVFFSLTVTTKLSSSRMSPSDQGTNVGGQTVAVGPTVGCKVGTGVDVGTTVASTEGIRVGSDDAVGSGFVVWMDAGLHAWSSKAHSKARTKREALTNMVEKLYMVRS